MESIPQHIFFKEMLRSLFIPAQKSRGDVPWTVVRKKASPGHVHNYCNPSQGLRPASLASGSTKQEFFGARRQINMSESFYFCIKYNRRKGSFQAI